MTTDRPAGRPADAPPGREPDGFAQFVAARGPALLATAWLLTGDRDRAEDLVQEALARSWQAWVRIRSDRPEAYVRQTMINLNISWWRRRWRAERPVGTNSAAACLALSSLAFAAADYRFMLAGGALIRSWTAAVTAGGDASGRVARAHPYS